MVRILVFGLGPGVGGVGSLIMNIYRNIDRNKIQLDFVIPGKEAYFAEEIKKLGGRIYYITPKKENFIMNIKDLFSMLKKNHREYDIAYFNLSALYYNFPFIISKLFGFPLIISHAHASEPENINKNLRYYLHIINRRLVANTSDYLFSCSNLATKWVFGSNEEIKKNTIIIPNGIDVSLYEDNEETRKIIRKQLKISDEDFVIGHVGRLSIEKNHLFLIDIFNEIKKEKRNAKLLLVGDGNYKDQIISKIIQLGLKDSVILTGIRTDIPELLNSMDVFVLPSMHEGFGIALIEAQAAGLQAFASKKTIPKEVDVTDTIKFIELDKSPEIWANEILKTTNGSNNKDMRSLIKNSGYDIVSIAATFQKFILDITNKKNH